MNPLTFYVLWQKRYRKIGTGTLSISQDQVHVGDRPSGPVYGPGLKHAWANVALDTNLRYSTCRLRRLQRMFNTGSLYRFRAYMDLGYRLSFRAYIASGAACSNVAQFSVSVSGPVIQQHKERRKQ